MTQEDVRPSTDGPSPSPERAIGDAAVMVVDAFTIADLLAGVTPERLGAVAGYAASSVRYRLARARREADVDRADGSPIPPSGNGNSGWAFDRDLLCTVMVEAMFARLQAATAETTKIYLSALDLMAQGADIATFGRAIQADLAAFSPGASPTDLGAAAENARMLALVACDESPAIRRTMRAEYERWIEQYLPVYHRLFEVVERVPLDGVAPMDIAVEVSIYLQGLAERRRFDPEVSTLQTLRTVVGIFCSWTRRADGAEDIDPVGTLLARVTGGG